MLQFSSVNTRVHLSFIVINRIYAHINAGLELYDDIVYTMNTHVAIES